MRQPNVNLQILDTVLSRQGDRGFNYGVGTSEQEAIDSHTTDFLISPNRARAIAFSTALLDIHDKGGTFKPFLSELSRIEREPIIGLPNHRDHIIHSCLVYCLGIYIYLSFPEYKQAIHEEIHKSIEGGEKRSIFSGGTVEGEFSFRWRLASLLHDIAYPFQIIHPTKLDKFLQYINTILAKLPRTGKCSPLVRLTPENCFYELNSLSFYGSTVTNLIKNVSNIVPFDLEDYFNRLWGRKGRIDHGILSCLLVCKLADILYEYHYANGSINEYGISWNKANIPLSIAQAAAAIAYHNIDPTSKILTEKEKTGLTALSSTHLLIGLLRLSDTLQDWGRPLASTSVLRRQKFSNQVRLDVNDNNNSLLIEFSGASEQNKESLRKQLQILRELPIRVKVL